MFKVVKTVENNKVFFSAVPEHWEDENILFWPNDSKTLKKQSDGSSIPGPNWQKIKCCVKKQDIITYKDATDFVKWVTDLTDTESEERITAKKDIRRKHPVCQSEAKDMKNFNTYFKSSPQENVSNIFEEQEELISDKNTPGVPTTSELTSMVQSTYQNDINFLTACAAETMSTKNFITPNNQTDQNQFINVTQINEEEHIETLGNEELVVVSSIQPVLENVVSRMCTLETEISKMNVKLDKLLNGRSTTLTERHEDTLETLTSSCDILLPITTVELLNKLEDKLRDQNFFGKLVKALSQINGSSGKQNGTRAAYRLADSLFTRKVLTEYTWTGMTKLRDKKKLPFVAYTNILDLFYRVVYLADTHYDLTQNESFFKSKLLKYSEARTTKKLKKKVQIDPKTVSPDNVSHDTHNTIVDKNNDNELEDSFQRVLIERSVGV